MAELSDHELLDALGVEAEPEKKSARTAREERIIAGFEEIQRFFDEHGRAPRHGEDLDIFERLYAVRLDRMRKLEECRAILEPLDSQGLLEGEAGGLPDQPEAVDDAALLAQLGVEAETDTITTLRHVRPGAEKRAAEEIANRQPCKDFEKFRPLFQAVQNDIDLGVRTTRQIRKDAGFLKSDIRAGDFFVIGGQTAYIAEVGDTFKAPNGENDARLRVIYSNGTESDILLRSLQRAIYKDEASRRISEPAAGPLFADHSIEGDAASGTIYVLRSKSDHPLVAENRDVVHKIGVTSGSVEKRLANAAHDATFLLADVEIAATYDLYNINRTKLENLLHRFFEAARLDIQIKDRFGHPVTPREWFLVPLFVIDQVVDKIRAGTIAEFYYDPKSASLKTR